MDVLGCGDDPDVEPGETAIRAFIDRAGHPADTWEDDKTVMQAFEKANRQAISWLHRDGRYSLDIRSIVHFIHAYRPTEA